MHLIRLNVEHGQCVRKVTNMWWPMFTQAQKSTALQRAYAWEVIDGRTDVVTAAVLSLLYISPLSKTSKYSFEHEFEGRFTALCHSFALYG